MNKRVTFIAISSLTAEPNGDDWINESNQTELRVAPDALADMFLDSAGEPNKDGCEMYMRAAVSGIAAIMLYMEVKGWYTKEEARDIIYHSLEERILQGGNLSIRKPPPGGIAG